MAGLLFLLAILFRPSPFVRPDLGEPQPRPPQPPDRAEKWTCPPDAASPADYHPYPYARGMHTLCVYPKGKMATGYQDTQTTAWYAVVLGPTGLPVSPEFGPNSSPSRAAAWADEWRRS